MLVNESNCLLVGVIEVYFDVNDYKVPAQNVWARICLSVNVIEYRYIFKYPNWKFDQH